MSVNVKVSESRRSGLRSTIDEKGNSCTDSAITFVLAID